MNQPKTLTEFFDSPAKWTQGHYACDAKGDPLGHDCRGMMNSWNRPEAVCWCVTGAIRRLQTLQPDYPGDDFLVQLEATVPVGSAITWNDTPGLTFKEFRQTIRQVEAELGLIEEKS